MPEWYYRDGHDRIVGPLKPSELLAMIRGGDLKEDTLVRKDDSQWVRSSDINGLWAAAALPDAEFSCPVCGTAIHKPPCRCPKCMKYVEKGVGKLKKVEVSAKQLAKIREAASQPVHVEAHTPKPNVEENVPHIHHVPVMIPNQHRSSRWWHSLLPRKK